VPAWYEPLVLRSSAKLAGMGVELTDPATSATHVVTWDLVPVVWQFQHPKTPRDAVEDLERELGFDAGVVLACVRRLIQAGVLGTVAATAVEARSAHA
jgi:hypothetical protein